MSIFSASLRTRCIAIAALGISLSMTCAPAQGQDKNASRIAVVDEKRVFDKCLTAVRPTGDYDPPRWERDVLIELNSWDLHRYLDEADQRALSQIEVRVAHKVPLTPQELETKRKLEDASKALFDEYLALQTKVNPTPVDIARLKVLSDKERETAKRIKARQTATAAEIQLRVDLTNAKIKAAIITVITEVANAEGIETVVDSGAILYTTRNYADITDEVLKRLLSGNKLPVVPHIDVSRSSAP